MTKDVSNSALTEIKVDFQPAVINIDREAIEAQVAAAVAQYSGQEVTVENYKAVYEERTRFNKLKEGLDNKRKDIKREISKPLTEFERWMKEKVIEPIDAVTAEMTTGLNAIDEHERMMRVDIVRATFEDKCMVAGLEKSLFESKYDEYSLKKYFKTGKFELKKSTLDEMDALVLAEFDKLEEYKANKQAIEEQAQEYDLPADGYIRHFEDGKSLVDVLKMMKSDRDAVTLRKEQQEAQAKAEADRQADIERMAKEQANANIKAIDVETGEIIENELSEAVAELNTPPAQEAPQDGAKFEPSEPQTYDLRITFHGGGPHAKYYKELFEKDKYGVTTETLFNGKTQEELAGGTFNVFQ